MAANPPGDDPGTDVDAPEDAALAEPAAAAPQNIRGRAAFVPHVRSPWREGVAAEATPNNLIHRARNPDEAWIEEATAKIGDWRAMIRSVYLRWALTINASVLAERRYRDMAPDQALRTESLRVRDGQPQPRAVIALWPAPEAADNYAQITPLISAYGVSDLFGALEEVVFELYEIFLRHDFSSLMRGEEFLPLRRLYRQRVDSPEAALGWEEARAARYDAWRRKRTYDGLHAVLLSFLRTAGLRRPSSFQHTDIEDWATTLEMIGELRNLIVHGAATVSEKLGRLSGTQISMTFDFAAGDEIDVKLHHLQSVECYCDQLLTALNIALIEKVRGPLGGGARPGRA